MHSHEQRRLGSLSLAALLVSAHYGLGFLLGTAEETLTLNVAGSLYAVSLSAGLFALLLVAQFYWTKVEQIWTLLGDRYGTQVKVMIGMMAWASLIGIEAVQIISGAAVLHLVQIPPTIAMISIAGLAVFLSLLPLQRASRLFQGLLLFNILALLYTLLVLHGFPAYVRSPFQFIPDLTHLSGETVIGISVSTILLVLIDMKCQQFLVQAKDRRSLYQGCILASLALFLLSFLPSAVVIAARELGVLPEGLDSKTVIPYLLTWAGGGVDHWMGIVLLLALIVPALGVSSSILRVQTKNVIDLGIISPFPRSQLLITGINALLGLIVALKGGSIIGLIMEFYAAYIAAVWVPFAAYLLAHSGRYVFSTNSVRLSLLMGSLSALAMLVVTIAFPAIHLPGNIELTIMVIGIGFGVLGLLVGQLIEKYFSILPIREK